MLRCTTHDVSLGWTVCKVSVLESGEAEWRGTGGVFATSLYLRLPISPPGQSCDLATRTDSTTKKMGMSLLAPRSLRRSPTVTDAMICALYTVVDAEPSWTSFQA